MRIARLVGTAILATATVIAASLTAVSPASAHGTSATVSQPIYSYADAVRESVYVQTTLDNDHDGVGDKVAVDLVRPRTDHRVPIVMEASPYYSCCGRGNEGEIKEYDANGVITKEPLFYDNYFVPRGYAFVGVDLAGTNRSTGCEDVGGPEEVASAKAVIDWLNGRAKATYADGTPAVATWSTGKVGMIGKSWDGSIANGVAATGVKGLETIVPIAGISSWYDYERFNGVLRSPGYTDFLHEIVSGRPASACAQTLAQISAASDDATGDFNGYWARRDFRLDASKVHASVLIAHGINDTNVTTTQFAQWWGALHTPKKIWLSQMSHVDPFDIDRAAWVDLLHRWFDFYLLGLRNGVDREPQATIETAPGTWVTQSSWPAAGTHDVRVSLGNGDGVTGTLGGPSTGTRTWLDNVNLSENQAVANPGTPVAGREAFLSAPLTNPVSIQGTPTATLKVKVDKPTTELTVRLVDYGTASRVNYLGPEEGIRTTTATQSCWGESTATDDACYYDTTEDVVTSDHAVLTRGWQDAAHHVSLRFTTPLSPNRWYTITVPMQATSQNIATGHVLGLIVQQSDNDYSSPTPQNATVTLDLRGSYVTLPLVGHAGLPKPATTAPKVTTAPAPAVRSLTKNAPQLP